MSNLKTRLIKLESTMTAKTEPPKIARFIVAPGVDPIGYVCGDVTVIRKLGESIEALHNRCSDAAIWPEGNYRQLFYLLGEGTCH